VSDHELPVLFIYATDFDGIDHLRHSRVSKRAETAQGILGNRYSVTIGHDVESENATASTAILSHRRQTLYMCHIHPTSSSYPFRGIVQRPDGVLQLDSFCYIICRQWTFRYGRRHGGLEEIHWTVVLADVMMFAQDKNALLSLVAAWRVIMTGRTPPKGSATPRAKIAYLS